MANSHRTLKLSHEEVEQINRGLHQLHKKITALVMDNSAFIPDETMHKMLNDADSYERLRKEIIKGNKDV